MGVTGEQWRTNSFVSPVGRHITTDPLFVMPSPPPQTFLHTNFVHILDNQTTVSLTLSPLIQSSANTFIFVQHTNHPYISNSNITISTDLLLV